MSPYFTCYSCSRVIECEQNANKCPLCKSANGRIITDDEFRDQYDRDVIKRINPNTREPFKK